MRGGAGIMGVVTHGSNAAIHTHQHGHKSSGVHVLRPIGGGHGLMHDRGVIVGRVWWGADLIRNDARDLTLPRVDMWIAEAGNEDHLFRIHNDGPSTRSRGAQVGGYGRYLFPLN